MTNITSGIIAAFIFAMFAGGLAISIWENTKSVAFILIVMTVLGACFVDVWQSIKPDLDKLKK